MSSHLTVMFASDLPNGKYMVGVQDSAGRIVDFTEVILPRVNELNRDDAFYLVVLAQDFRSASVSPVSIYKAYFKTHQRPVAQAMLDGSIDGLEISNEILRSFNKKTQHGH